MTHRAHAIGFAALIVLSASLTWPAAAEEDPLRGIVRDPEAGEQLLDPDDDEPSPADWRLPALPSGSGIYAELDGFFCRRIEVTGVTRLDPAQLRALLAPYENRTLTAEDLQALRHSLTRAYVDRGFVTSGVLIPDQRLEDGVVRLQAIEGALQAIETVGPPVRLSLPQALRPLNDLVGTPVELGALRAALLAVEADRRVQAVRAELMPTGVPGESRLNLELVPAAAFAFSLRADNHRAPSVGAEQLQLGFSHASLFGISDELQLSLGSSRGLDEGSLNYRLPLAASPLALTLGGSRSSAGVIEEPFDQLDLESRSRRAQIGLDWRRSRRPGELRGLAIGLDNTRSSTLLLGEPFSFAPGVVDGRSAVSALRLSAERRQSGERSAWSARAQASFGLGVFAATRNVDQPDSRFHSLRLQAHYLRDLGRAGQDQAGQHRLALRGELQWADRALLPLEKLALGGAHSIRGHRHNRLVRDQGIAVSAEYQRELFDARLLWLLFVDAGYGRDRGSAAPPGQRLSGAGTGLRLAPTPRWAIELDWAHGFQRATGATRNLQDRGIHASVQYRWP